MATPEERMTKRRYVTRWLEPELKAAAAEFPVVLLTGPRQSGKSTLLQHVFSDANYLTLDDPLLRKLALDDPRLFLENAGSACIIDEIQYAPELLSYIKMEVDRDRGRTGRFILTGSQHFPMMQDAGESLAGRVAIFELLPFAWREAGLEGTLRVADCFKVLYKGFYPDPLVHGVDRNRYYGSYLQTYIERDIRQMTAVQDLRRFQEFIELLAARAGGLLNLNEVAKECGISVPTAKRWLSLLESSRIVFLLRAFHRNVSKRVIKSPKLYFADTGLLAYLLRYPDAGTMWSGPMAGAFFENFMVVEALKRQRHRRATYELYFYRDSNRNEIDLVVEYGRRYLLLEIKLSKTPRAGDADGLKRLIEPFGQEAQGAVLAFVDAAITVSPQVRILPWSQLDALLDGMASGQPLNPIHRQE